MEPASRTVLFLAATAVGCGACSRSEGPSSVNLLMLAGEPRRSCAAPTAVAPAN
jgi:hypothetical protein